MLTVCFWGWAVIEIINHLGGRWERLGQAKQIQDRGSYWLLIGAVYLCFALAYAGRWSGWGVLTGPWQYLGLGLMALGVAFREWAIITLGRHFSVVVALETNHQLITRGPYRWLRHPAYSGGFITMLGFVLALGSGGSLGPILIVLLAAFTYRIHCEERLLSAAFGQTYRDYMRRTWRLFPGW